MNSDELRNRARLKGALGFQPRQLTKQIIDLPQRNELRNAPRHKSRAILPARFALPVAVTIVEILECAKGSLRTKLSYGLSASTATSCVASEKYAIYMNISVDKAFKACILCVERPESRLFMVPAAPAGRAVTQRKLGAQSAEAGSLTITANGAESRNTGRF